MRFGNLYNLCSYQSPYPPVADKVVKRHLEQTAEETRNRLAKAGIHPPRHSGAGRNPVVDLSHSRPGGNDNSLNKWPRLPLKSGLILTPWQPLLDSSLRWNDDETIDALRQPYSLNPCPRHSGESRNPVVDPSHSRPGGNDLYPPNSALAGGAFSHRS